MIHKHRRNDSMIYLDNSATTKPYEEVLETFSTVSKRYFGNPSSLHQVGLEAEKLIEIARQQIGDHLSVKPNEVFFTSGGTEGNNLAIKGVANGYKKRGRHVITTAIEHPSTLAAFKQLESQGFQVTYLPVDRSGRLSIQRLMRAIRDDTILVSVIHVNNEIGVIQNVGAIGEQLRRYPKLFFHVDHVQGASKVALSIDEANIDLCTISGHKLHGLKGTGVLTVREGITLYPLFSGGGQEQGIRSGTENVAGAVSLAKAIRLVYERSSTELAELKKLKEYTLDQLSKLNGVVINTPRSHSAPHIVNFSVPELKPEVLIHSLSEEGIYVSTRAACSSKRNERSHVIVALGAGEERAQTAIRISFSFETTREQIDTFLLALTKHMDGQKTKL